MEIDSNAMESKGEVPAAAKMLSGPGVTYWSRPNEERSGLLHCPPKKIMKLVGQAVKDWEMICEG
jgi:hypothetical protein